MTQPELAVQFYSMEVDSYTEFAKWFSKKVFFYSNLACCYPTFMAIRALGNGGGGHWHCLWMIHLLVICLWTSREHEFLIFGLAWILIAVFIFKGHRELRQLTDDV